MRLNEKLPARDTAPTQHTVVMQASYMKSDIRPLRDRECRPSTIGVVHCQGGIFRGYLRDERYLITIKYYWLRSGAIFNATYGGAVDRLSVGFGNRLENMHLQQPKRFVENAA